MKKKSLLSASAIALALPAVLVPSAAFASTPWPGDIVNSSYRWEITTDLDFYGSTDAADVFSSQLYETGLLNLSDGVLTEWSGDWCADPIDAPGGVTNDGADTIITCAPYVIGAGQPGEGLTATVEIRIFDALNVARLSYKLENTTGSDITVPDVYINVVWEYGTDNGLTSSGVRGTGSGDMSFGATDTWIITAESNTEIPSGIAWAACGQTGFTVTGDDAADMSIGTGETTTFAAGSTTYYAAFLQMQTPADQTDDAMNAAIDALGATMTERYKSLPSELSVGFLEGVTVEFWTSSCPDPELPNTGIDNRLMIGLGALAATMVLCGVIVVVRRRVRAS